MKTTAQHTKQLSFSQAEYGSKKKPTRRDVFLTKMESVVPWARLNAVIEPYYPKSGKRGRPPIGLERILRMYFVQQWYGLAGVVCFWGVTGLKKLLGIDDSLDVFGIHGVGGVLGALGTGVLAPSSLGGTGVYDYATGKIADYSIIGQVTSQAWGVGVTILWSGIVSLVLFKLIDKVMGLRVAEEAEREGLDTTSHGERAYNF